MSTLVPVSLVPRIPATGEVLRVRTHAALVRALLEELDRVLPPASAAKELELAEQLIEELTQLGYRVLDCAAKMTRSEGATSADSTSDERKHRRPQEPTLIGKKARHQ
jgi:hypothetical protein